MGLSYSHAGSGSSLRKSSRGGGSSHDLKLLNAGQVCGIVRIELAKAHLNVRDYYFATVSLGMQTFRTATYTSSDKPAWQSEKKIVLEKEGARIARVCVFESNTITKNNCVAFCEIDLSDVLEPDGARQEEEYELRDPRDRSKSVGAIWLSYSAETREEVERDFARRVLSLMDADENGVLSKDEFQDLLQAFGNRLSETQIQALFDSADVDRTGTVSASELSAALAHQPTRALLVNRCPVCGEKLEVADGVNDMIHMTLCFDEGTGNQIMSGSYLTEKQASLGWMFKLSEWANFSTYDTGIKEGRNTSHILVFDRHTKRLVEELVDKKIVLALRTVYHSKLGRSLLEAGTKSMLVSMSQRQGVKMSDPASAALIPKFISFFEDQIQMEEVEGSLSSFLTFNDFFTRKLKPGSRPIAHADNHAVAVCAADCRLTVFDSSSAAQNFWIKGGSQEERVPD